MPVFLVDLLQKDRSMSTFAIDDEPARQHELDSFAVLDTFEEQAYDDITRAAAELCGTPIALISLTDRHRQWFKSRVGLQATEIPRENAFCAAAICTPNAVTVVEDTMRDTRYAGHPLVVADPNIRFYVGAPLVTSSGHALGTLCALDRRPRQLDANQLETLQFLARQVIAVLEQRRRERGAAAASDAAAPAV